MKKLYSEAENFINDPDDFSPPYKLVGKLEREILFDKYNRLRKQSKGCLIRLGFFTNA